MFYTAYEFHPTPFSLSFLLFLKLLSFCATRHISVFTEETEESRVKAIPIASNSTEIRITNIRMQIQSVTTDCVITCEKSVVYILGGERQRVSAEIP